MGYYLLEYALIDDYLNRRTAFREEHLALAREAHRRGDLILAGALSEPPDRAVLVWRTNDRSIVERFADSDPYVRNGLVTAWTSDPGLSSSATERPRADAGHDLQKSG
jgi:uncharacterized protein